MPILDIVLFPDPGLREQCQSVAEVTADILALLDNMAETMYDAPGIGLAAPQIGIQKQIIVVDVGDESDDFEDESVDRDCSPRSAANSETLLKLINPEITEKHGSVDSEEGCLSIPGIRETIKRSERVVVNALNERGQAITIEAQGMLAICLQHEIDHLNGVLFIDHLSRIKRQLLKSKMKKILTE